MSQLVLAAGGSTRLGGGQAKQLLHFEGETLVRRAARTALAAVGEGGAAVIVVLGHRAEECAAELAGLPVRTAFAERWAAGLGASLKAGLRELLAAAPGTGAVVVSLCDQPMVRAADLAGLARAWSGSGSGWDIVASEYQGGLGVPALFARETFPEVAALNDAAGAKGLISRFAAAGRVGRVPLPAAALDVDTAEDYRRLTGR